MSGSRRSDLSDYDRWHRELYKTDFSRAVQQNRRYYDLVSRMLGLDRLETTKALLDVPCGKGDLLEYFRSRNYPLLLAGLDVSRYAVEEAHRHLGGGVVSGDAENLPYPDRAFDFITCLGGLEYYRNPGKGAAEMSRVLAAGGKAFIHVPNLMFLGHIYLCFRDGRMPSEGSGDGAYYDYRTEKFFTFQGWRDLIERAGLKILAARKYNRIGGSRKVSGPARFLYHRLLRHLVPFHLSYNYLFLCEKRPSV